MKTEETWTDVVGFEGVYEVNWDGEVRSIDRMITDPKTGAQRFRRGRKVKQSKNLKGSPQVVLVKADGKRKTVRVYTLLMDAFSEDMGGVENAERFITEHDNPGRGKVYEFKDPEGEYVKVQNLSSFCKERGLHTSNMCQVHAGKLQSSKGWRKWAVVMK